MTFKPFFAAVAAFAAAAPGIALADTGTVSRVHYGDLDLSAESGQRIFDRRLARATAAVCGTPDAGSRFAVANCRTATERDAREQLRRSSAAAF